MNTFTMKKQLQLSKVDFLLLFLILGIISCNYVNTNASPLVQNMKSDLQNCKNRPLGKTYQRTNCEYCICHAVDEEPMCYFEECWDPKCVDSVRISGKCCKTCPNGPNCQHYGIVIKEKEERMIGNLICSCLDSEVDTFGDEKPKAVCISFKIV